MQTTPLRTLLIIVIGIVLSYYLVPVSEAVDYKKIMALGHGTHAALIGISGISITILLFLISLSCLNHKFIQGRPALFSFFFWLTSINLMEIFSYAPNRTFIMGDIGEFVQGLNISPLWIFIPGTLLVCLALYRFYKYEVIKFYQYLAIKNIVMQRIILWLTFWPLILSVVYWEPPTHWKILSNTTNAVSLLLIIFILIVCDPGRKKKNRNLV